jgi:cysteine desulfurase
VQENGLIDIEEFKAAIRPDTILVSVMYVNNEIGVIQDIPQIGEICREKGIIFHVDATQAPGKVKMDMNVLKVDLMSLSPTRPTAPRASAHCTCVASRAFAWKPRCTAVAMSAVSAPAPCRRTRLSAWAKPSAWPEEMDSESERIRMLRDRLWNGIKDMEEVYINGDIDQRVPHNLNVSFNFVEGESLIMAIKDLAVSSGSACTSARWSRPTCCAPWAATTKWHTAPSALPWAASPPKKKSTSPLRC